MGSSPVDNRWRPRDRLDLYSYWGTLRPVAAGIFAPFYPNICARRPPHQRSWMFDVSQRLGWRPQLGEDGMVGLRREKGLFERSLTTLTESPLNQRLNVVLLGRVTVASLLDKQFAGVL